MLNRFGRWARSLALAAVLLAAHATAGAVDTSIWQFTGTPCSGGSCPGWVKLDDNSLSIVIVTGGGQLYQQH